VEDPGIPGPEPHPGLVRQAFADNDGNPWVTVVYGTSQDPFKSGNQYYTVAKVSELIACNLDRATRFDLRRCLELPWAEEYFEPLPGQQAPTLGHLSAYAVRVLQMQIAYYQQLGAN
jgi:hypothetical protein